MDKGIFLIYLMVGPQAGPVCVLPQHCWCPQLAGLGHLEFVPPAAPAPPLRFRGYFLGLASTSKGIS